MMRAFPARSPGPLGRNDAADPWVLAFPGDTPGLLGYHDGAHVDTLSRTTQTPASGGHAPTAVRLLSSMLYGATLDAGVVGDGLLAFHVKQGDQRETSICEFPAKGLYRKAVAVSSMGDIVSALKGFGSKASTLGILAHGDSGGTIELGDEVLNVWKLDSFRSKFRDINDGLRDDATVYIYGCVSATGQNGTALLKEISKMLPHKKVVGFNVIVIVKPSSPRSEGGTFLSCGGRRCYDPDMWATTVQSTVGAGTATLWNDSVPATPDASSAKVALDGEITVWPKDEESRKEKNDAFVEPLKLDAETMQLVKKWESQVTAEGRYTREQVELYRWTDEMVDRFNASLPKASSKKKLPKMGATKSK
jgi:hypothetical protein